VDPYCRAEEEHVVFEDGGFAGCVFEQKFPYADGHAVLTARAHEPQRIDEHAAFVLDKAFTLKDFGIRFGFNPLHAGPSFDHFHVHMVRHAFPIEHAAVDRNILVSNEDYTLARIDDFPGGAFVLTSNDRETLARRFIPLHFYLNRGLGMPVNLYTAPTPDRKGLSVFLLPRIREYSEVLGRRVAFSEMTGLIQYTDSETFEDPALLEDQVRRFYREMDNRDRLYDEEVLEAVELWTRNGPDLMEAAAGIAQSGPAAERAVEAISGALGFPIEAPSSAEGGGVDIPVLEKVMERSINETDRRGKSVATGLFMGYPYQDVEWLVNTRIEDALEENRLHYPSGQGWIHDGTPDFLGTTPEAQNKLDLWGRAVSYARDLAWHCRTPGEVVEPRPEDYGDLSVRPQAVQAFKALVAKVLESGDPALFDFLFLAEEPTLIAFLLGVEKPAYFFWAIAPDHPLVRLIRETPEIKADGIRTLVVNPEDRFERKTMLYRPREVIEVMKNQPVLYSYLPGSLWKSEIERALSGVLDPSVSKKLAAALLEILESLPEDDRKRKRASRLIRFLASLVRGEYETANGEIQKRAERDALQRAA
jgi:hypothetical protein